MGIDVIEPFRPGEGRGLATPLAISATMSDSRIHGDVFYLQPGLPVLKTNLLFAA